MVFKSLSSVVKTFSLPAKFLMEMCQVVKLRFRCFIENQQRKKNQFSLQNISKDKIKQATLAILNENNISTSNIDVKYEYTTQGAILVIYEQEDNTNDCVYISVKNLVKKAKNL